MRERIAIDLKLAQSIINSTELTQEWSGQSPFFQAVAATYNALRGTAIDWQNFRLRCESGALTTTVAKGRRGRGKGQTISVEQKTAMREGRKNSSRKKSLLNSDINKKAAEVLLASCITPKGKSLAKRVINGDKKALNILRCYRCVGEDKGYIETIRNCSAYSCQDIYRRPYQNSDSDEEETIDES